MKERKPNSREPSPKISLEDELASHQARARKKDNAQTGFQRPTKRQKAYHSPSPDPSGNFSGNLIRLETAVLCGKLWFKSCQEANDDLPSVLPVVYQSAQQYISSFEALIFEEARESILHSRLDHSSAQIEVTVQGTEPLANGWKEVSLSPHYVPNQLREGAIMILSTQQLPPRASVEYYQDLAQSEFRNGRPPKHRHHRSGQTSGNDEESSGFVVAGVVKMTPGAGRGGNTIIGIHPQCEAHSGTSNSPCAQGMEHLRPGKRLWAVVLCPLTTQQREFTALHKIPSMSLGTHMLNPEGLRDLAKQVSEAHPQTAEGTLSKGVYGEGILNKMSSQYDATQHGAIVAATRHLDLDHSTGHIPRMPFVLICGPPGTGKTHTVTGILNIWHLSHYTQHQDAINLRFRMDLERGDLLRQGANSEEERATMSASKPRLLVCAPSNAAADEILQRVMMSGFLGNDGRTYFPNVVRVGAPGANIGEQARAVLVDTLVEGFLNMDPKTWQLQVVHLQHSMSQLNQNITALKAHLGSLEMPEEEGPARDLAIRQELESIRALVDRYDARSKQLLHLDRLQLVSNLANRRPGANIGKIRDALELSFVMEAEMVFTTLSSTGRKVFSKLQTGHFETVLIDEAAQASEVTTLQALTFGCQRVVLVGDPQQLPATILSQKGKDLMFERSLFERLQKAGCPVHTLQVQYRMHPFIRQFPSTYFYEDALKDGQSVLDRPEEVFYRNRYLKPYVFFDVDEGRDIRSHDGANSGSRRNQAEADLAVALFQALREELLVAARKNTLKGPVLVGVITPYREQVTCIKQTLVSVLGAELAKEVDVSTVDSYQGRQLDVIILSAVRANPQAAGVGFLNDVRRLNVSITRAKRALWILGSAATLRQSAVWASLIEDADRRGAVVQKASARLLFPDLPHQNSSPGAQAMSAFPPDQSKGPNQADQHMQDTVNGGAMGKINLMEELEMGAELDLGTGEGGNKAGGLRVNQELKITPGSTANSLHIPGLDLSPTHAERNRLENEVVTQQMQTGSLEEDNSLMEELYASGPKSDAQEFRKELSKIPPRSSTEMESNCGTAAQQLEPAPEPNLEFRKNPAGGSAEEEKGFDRKADVTDHNTHSQKTCQQLRLPDQGTEKTATHEAAKLTIARQQNGDLQAKLPLESLKVSVAGSELPMDPRKKLAPQSDPRLPNSAGNEIPTDPRQRAAAPTDPRQRPFEHAQRPMDPRQQPSDDSERLGQNPPGATEFPVDPRQRQTGLLDRPMDPRQRPAEQAECPVDPRQRPPPQRPPGLANLVPNLVQQAPQPQGMQPQPTQFGLQSQGLQPANLPPGFQQAGQPFQPPQGGAPPVWGNQNQRQDLLGGLNLQPRNPAHPPHIQPSMPPVGPRPPAPQPPQWDPPTMNPRQSRPSPPAGLPPPASLPRPSPPAAPHPSQAAAPAPRPPGPRPPGLPPPRPPSQAPPRPPTMPLRLPQMPAVAPIQEEKSDSESGELSQDTEEEEEANSALLLDSIRADIMGQPSKLRQKKSRSPSRRDSSRDREPVRHETPGPRPPLGEPRPPAGYSTAQLPNGVPKPRPPSGIPGPSPPAGRPRPQPPAGISSPQPPSGIPKPRPPASQPGPWPPATSPLSTATTSGSTSLRTGASQNSMQANRIRNSVQSIGAPGAKLGPKPPPRPPAGIPPPAAPAGIPPPKVPPGVPGPKPPNARPPLQPPAKAPTNQHQSLTSQGLAETHAEPSALPIAKFRRR